MISNCGHDENGKYNGGVAGDQTGKEWEIIPFYKRPWTKMLRHPDPKVGELIASLAREAANNDLVGYDQGARTTFWKALAATGTYHPKDIKVPCEADCSGGVVALIKAVGKLLCDMKLSRLSENLYTGNMAEALKKAGFIEYTDAKYLNSDDYLIPGDVLLYPGHHTATNLDTGKMSKKTIADPNPLGPGWHTDAIGHWYRHTQGKGPNTYYHDGFYQVNNKWYAFDHNGYVVIDKNRIQLNPDCSYTIV